jgi:hypothetical protein
VRLQQGKCGQRFRRVEHEEDGHESARGKREKGGNILETRRDALLD